MLTNDEIKALLEQELEAMKLRKEVRRYSVTYKPFTGKFDIWFEFPDGNATTFPDILTVDDFKGQFANCLPVKKSWKCHICRYYIKNCDGCKRGFYNSMFIPCPDWKGPEFAPEDKDMVDALESLKREAYCMPEILHKGADWLMTFILKIYGYYNGLSIYEKTPKGYWKDTKGYVDIYENIINWQCLLCNKFNNRTMTCTEGLDEGWIQENHCSTFVPLPDSITPEFFKYLMSLIKQEHDDNDLSWEATHYNMDRAMSFTIQSLGYFEFAKKYRELKLDYLDVPF